MAIYVEILSQFCRDIDCHGQDKRPTKQFGRKPSSSLIPLLDLLKQRRRIFYDIITYKEDDFHDNVRDMKIGHGRLQGLGDVCVVGRGGDKWQRHWL